MIIDKLENIVKYGSIIPESVIEFLIHLSPEAVAGHNKIKDGMYANIDIYPPKPYENCKFEAHKKYIDIQELTRELCLELIEYVTVDEYSADRPRVINIYYKFIDKPLKDKKSLYSDENS